MCFDEKMKPELSKKIIDTEMRPLSSVLYEKGNIYTFLNPVSYLEAQKHKGLFLRYDGIFADGSLLAAAIRILYSKNVTRRSFDMTSVAPQLLEFALQNKKTLYIVASKQEQVERAVTIIREKYVGINIIGYRNGYFTSVEEEKAEANHIVEVAPDYLIVGMGVIAQEDFLLRVKEAGYDGIGFTCGGFIHQTARGETDYYPAWVDRMNIRFLYRMWKEPHTRKRYFVAGLIFPARFVWERFFG